nr:unnamed protein product [Callosobruchus analis]
MEKVSRQRDSAQKKVLLLCKQAGVSPVKKQATPRFKKATSPFNKGNTFETSPFRIREMSSPSSVSARSANSFSMPKIISVTSLEEAEETEQPNALPDSTPSSSGHEMQVVDLTD